MSFERRGASWDYSFSLIKKNKNTPTHEKAQIMNYSWFCFLMHMRMIQIQQIGGGHGYVINAILEVFLSE